MKRDQLIKNQRGISLGEVLLVVILISILSVVMVPRFLRATQNARWEACRTNVANINALVQLYYIKEGTWPLMNLADIETNISYFPEEALPSCPVTTTATYWIVEQGHRVTKHIRGQDTHP